MHYVIGAYQAKVRQIQAYAFAMTDLYEDFIARCRSMLEETLETSVYQGTVHTRGKTRHRLVLWSKEFLDHLREATDDNQRCYPARNPAERRDYLSGVLDARGSVSHSPHISALGHPLEYPRIIVTKNNPNLIASLGVLCRSIGIEPTLDETVLRIHRLSDMRRIIRHGLLRQPEKRDHLQKLYGNVKEYQEIA